ncbi:hypothetical protein ACFL2D_03320 [Patescibacteria group bacterium]
MYYYIFDDYLNNPENEQHVQDINAILNDLTVQGERGRISPVRRLQDIMRDAHAKKIETVVMVGNEDSISKAIGYALDYDFTLGYVPADPDDVLGAQLGINSPREAGHALSARVIEELYPIQVNDKFFITEIRAQIGEKQSEKGFFSRFSGAPAAQDIRILFDENYFVSGDFEELTIYNTKGESDNPLVTTERINPDDQVFEVAFKTALPKYRFMKKEHGISKDAYKDMSPYNLLKTRKIEVVQPKGLEFISGNSVIAKIPCVIQAAPKKLKMIVGKGREV